MRHVWCDTCGCCGRLQSEDSWVYNNSKEEPILIYDHLFLPLLHLEGIWDQVRVDHGTEFSLVATAQLYLSSHRLNTHHQPILQSLSRQNHRVERIWPEVNQRVNYPLKRVLIDMENREEINMGNEVSKFCVSYITIRVMEYALRNFIQAWNMHRIPGQGGGIPNILALENNQVSRVCLSDIPSTWQMVTLHEQNGSRLCRNTGYGHDPLQGHTQLQSLRERDHAARFPNMEVVFQDLLHNNALLFRNCVQHYIHITNAFSQLLE